MLHFNRPSVTQSLGSRGPKAKSSAAGCLTTKQPRHGSGAARPHGQPAPRVSSPSPLPASGSYPSTDQGVQEKEAGSKAASQLPVRQKPFYPSLLGLRPSLSKYEHQNLLRAEAEQSRAHPLSAPISNTQNSTSHLKSSFLLQEPLKQHSLYTGTLCSEGQRCPASTPLHEARLLSC